jgi:predicted DnaQ family exonuclease/DinG family helicase
VTVGDLDVESILGNGGRLSALMPGFEERREQLEMARAVACALENEKVLLAEAGTGTGKTFAYLVPLILRAAATGRRAVVSTHTKNLQEQLFEKDLPLLARAIPLSFRYSLLKGRQNYLCRERLDDAVSAVGLLLPDAASEKLLPLADWARSTRTGDIAENAEFDVQRNADLWGKVSCDSRYCPAKNTPRSCFLALARERARDSHLVVVNHALLLTDIVAGRAILGDYDCLVVDEAHNLEKVASEQLGRSASFLDFHLFFERHFRKETGGSDITRALQRLGVGSGAKGKELFKDLAGGVKESRREVQRFFNGLGGFPDVKSDSPFPLRMRYRPGDAIASRLREEAVLPLEFLSHLLSLMAGIWHEIEDRESALSDADRPLAARVEGAVQELRELVDSFSFLTDAPREEWVYWMQGSGQGSASPPALKSSPVDVAPLLKEMIFERTESVVLSSATMSVGGDFSFISRRLGTNLLERERLVTFCGGSSFPLESQALLLLPLFMPSVQEAEFMNVLPGVLHSAVTAVNGGSLVLFTSKEWLRETHGALKKLLAREGVSSIAQDEDGSRESLLEQFRRGEKRVLLGTDSFWEGIDVPGEALSLVIIVRLPFPVPTDPVTEAVSEKIEAEGGDAFTDYSLPRAAIRLKQGFGRLIRTKDDRGAVLVLDKRIAGKRYGGYLLGGLPVAPQFVDDVRDIPLILERWCGGGRSSNPGQSLNPAKKKTRRT